MMRPGCFLSLCLVATCATAADVDTSPLPLKPVLAFPELKFTGWEPDNNGKPSPLRPILLTHAGDGSNRIFVPQQQGQVHVFKAGDAATKVFLDLSKKVLYKDNENEQGLLGLAFHPKYKENGQFFIFYSTKEPLLTTVVSRFTVSKSDPNHADPASEVELFRITHPFWNHKGGTICFGPDGYLYIALGDGGAGNDPLNNAQNLQSHLGKILRIDVDKKGTDTAYGIPADNPYANVIAAGGKQAIAKPEIYASGLRNVWRMSFDRQTGVLWAGDVGQNVWEEINLIVKGGNYGWNLREGKHVFSPNGAGVISGVIDPIWEYHHDIGKSITGGHVYRGQQVPELAGHYLYADYVSGKIWALKYDPASKTVVANRTIGYEGAAMPVISFGEDEAGEVYFMIVSATGQGIYKFTKK
jgi:glucose/arabinose dehydrogenase